MNRYEIDSASGLLVPRKREIVKPRHCSMAAMQQALLGGGGAAGGSDPYWSNVVLLCHFDGTNGQTTTTDSSSFAHGISGVTGLQLSTTKTKFGATSSYFGASSGSCSWGVADSEDWNFGSGQFTVECWLNIDSSIGNTAFAGQFAGSGSNNSWTFSYVSGLSFYYSTTGSNGGNNVTGSWTPSTNTWYHIAADRDASNVLRVYVDGVVKASATVSATFFNSTASLGLGCDVFASRLPGYIDELRITKGVARYAGAFTPPTAAFPNS